MNNSDLIAPTYDGKESVNSFQRRVSMFLLEMKKRKYTNVIDFFNNLLGEKKHSLIKFRNITHDDFIKKISDNKHFFVDNINFFKDEYNIEYNVNKLVDSVYAISIIRRILKTQNCSLKSAEKIIDNKNVLCYNIVNSK